MGSSLDSAIASGDVEGGLGLSDSSPSNGGPGSGNLNPSLKLQSPKFSSDLSPLASDGESPSRRSVDSQGSVSPSASDETQQAS